jgi:hypothetical protein
MSIGRTLLSIESAWVSNCNDARRRTDMRPSYSYGGLEAVDDNWGALMR